MLKLYVTCLAVLLWTVGSFPLFAAGQAKHFILVVWDGMRPDFVSPELTPVLCALREQGVWFASHHSAYPTSTEVNGTVLATGVFPEHNGVLANKEYRPTINMLKAVGTENLAAVRKGDETSSNEYINVPTLAEQVRAHDGHTAVAGAKPVALLHDRFPRSQDSTDLIWFAAGCLPESRLSALTNQFGVFPAAAGPNIGRDQWATHCLLDAFWGKELPQYSVLWLSEPDYSQHHYGVGSAEALAGIRNADQCLAMVLAELDRRGMRSQTDIMVVSDHGFSTIGQNGDVAAMLRQAGLNARSSWNNPPQTNDVMVVGNGGSVMVYVIGHSPATIEKVVAALQQNSTDSVLFTQDGLPGTFPLAEVKLDAPTAADVIVASGWKMNGQQAGRTRVDITNDGYGEYRPGDGMHVTLSPTDLHNLAVAAGPDFRRGVISPIPSGNVDVVPTFMWLMGIKPARLLDGRVLGEALTVAGPGVTNVELGCRDAENKVGNGVWRQQLKFTEVNGVRYLEEGNGALVTGSPQNGSSKK